MNASSKNRLPGAIGMLIGLAIVGVFAMDVAPPASATLAQGWFDYASLARAVGELTGLGFSIALLAFGLKRLATRQVEEHRTQLREASIGSNAAAPAVVIAVPRIHDATASELDDDARVPGFAPVLSLTEAQVERRRAERQRQERRTALKGA
jgi:hypothetical protein